MLIYLPFPNRFACSFCALEIINMSIWSPTCFWPPPNVLDQESLQPKMEISGLTHFWAHVQALNTCSDMEYVNGLNYFNLDSVSIHLHTVHLYSRNGNPRSDTLSGPCSNFRPYAPARTQNIVNGVNYFNLDSLSINLCIVCLHSQNGNPRSDTLLGPCVGPKHLLRHGILSIE